MKTAKYSATQLKELQSKSFEEKLSITKARIIEWYEYFGGNVYISYSGGKDSSVLRDIVHSIYPDVPVVFSNTGLEYPEIQQFARQRSNKVVTPKMNFRSVITTYGYPLISKEVSEAIYYARRIVPEIAEREQRSNTKKTRITWKTTYRKRSELLGLREDDGEYG